MPSRTAPVHPFDRRYGTDTGGLIPGRELISGSTSDQWITAYYAVAPSILDRLIDLWLQTRPPLPITHYTFLDVGAGKGRAMLTAAQHPFQQVLGVELIETLAGVARANIAKFLASAKARALAPLKLLEGDALEVALPSGPAVILMFHPFEAPILQRLLARLEQHFVGREGRLDILYVNAEHTTILDRNPAFAELFRGMVSMSALDHRADIEEIATQTDYGSTGDEFCTIYRFVGRSAV